MRIEKTDNVVFVLDAVDEHADFSKIKEINGVTVDFSNLSRVNAIGLRSWMKFLKYEAPLQMKCVGGPLAKDLIEIYSRMYQGKKSA